MNVHLIGVGGVGMAALAVLLRHRGHAASGCDLHDSPRLRWLRGEGVAAAVGHDPRHLEGIDCVIATPAVAAENAELAAARAACPCLRRRGEVLAELVSAATDSVAVCGSHGKTTTATFVARLLLALGERVEWAIGGETGTFPVAGGAAGGVLVAEADESDGTLALYRAKTLVVTNCEYDHADHFPTRADYVACYEAARRQAGVVIEGETLGPLAFLEALDAFRALAPHNRSNARAAVEVALRRGHAPEAIAAALPAVVAQLPDRRFQRLWPLGAQPLNLSTSQPLNFSVYTDYAHHPTEMACAVRMAREVCRGTLRVLFQPHRYSRTKALLGEFPKAFDGADETVLCPTYAAFERPIAGGGAADLLAACRAARPAGKFRLAPSCGEAWERVRRAMAPGDVTLLLGAGDIIALAPRVRAELAEKSGGTK